MPGGTVSAPAASRRRAAVPARRRRPTARRPPSATCASSAPAPSAGWSSTARAEQLWAAAARLLAGERLPLDDRRSPTAGVMETDWAENRAKIPQDFDPQHARQGARLASIRPASATSSAPAWSARANGGTEIYISHRGMEEVYTSAARRNTTVWQPRPADPELEAEFLRRLMVKLGAHGEQAKAAIAASGAGAGHARASRASVRRPAGAACRSTRASTAPGAASAWRSTAPASRSKTATARRALYFVRYVDPSRSARTEPGFFSRSSSAATRRTPTQPAQYRVSVKSPGRQDHRVGAGRQGRARERRCRPAHRRAARRGAEVVAGALMSRAVPSRDCRCASAASAAAAPATRPWSRRAAARARRGCWSTAASRCASSRRGWRAPACAGRHRRHVRHARARRPRRLRARAWRAAAHPVLDEPRHARARSASPSVAGCCASRATACDRRRRAASCGPSPCRTTRASRCSSRCTDGALRLGVLTDAGPRRRTCCAQLRGLRRAAARMQPRPRDARGIGYPASLKARIGGRLGPSGQRSRGGHPRAPASAGPAARRRRAPERAEQHAATRAACPAAVLGCAPRRDRGGRPARRLRLARPRLSRSAARRATKRPPEGGRLRSGTSITWLAALAAGVAAACGGRGRGVSGAGRGAKRRQPAAEARRGESGGAARERAPEQPLPSCRKRPGRRRRPGKPARATSS